MKAKKKTVGKVLIGVGVASLIVGAFQSEIENRPTDSHNQTATTYGQNSPAVNQSASTSGNNSPISQTVILTNTGVLQSPKINANFLTNNFRMDNGIYVNTLTVEIDSPYSVGSLYVGVHGEHILNGIEAPFDGAMLNVMNGSSQNLWFTKNPNAHGGLIITIYSSKPEKLWVEYRVER